MAKKKTVLTASADVGELITAIKNINKAFGKQETKLAALHERMNTTDTDFRELNKKLKKFTDKVDKSGTSTGDFNKELGKLQRKLTPLVDSVAKVAKSLGANKVAQAKLTIEKQKAAKADATHRLEMIKLEKQIIKEELRIQKLNNEMYQSISLREKATYSLIKEELAMKKAGYQEEIFASKLQQSLLATQQKKLAVDKARLALEKFGKTGAKAGNSVLLSWKTMARLFAVQSLHQLFGKLTAALSESIRTSVEFIVRIGEIQTISQKSQQSVGQWANQLRKLSDAFAIPVLEAAEGTYQAISNQIAKGAETTGFMVEAAKLSKVSHSSLADSVSALSSIINSYGLGAADANRISRMLFKTIELGRVRLSEIGDKIGTVTTLAAPLGIGFGELAALLQTLSIQGIAADRSLTMMRAVLLKLHKPTGEMTKFFEELGVNSGKAAISQFGLIGMFRKFHEEIQKNGITRIGEMSGRMRALIGILGGAGTKHSMDLFNSNFEETMSNTNEYSNAIGIAMENAGLKFNKTLEEMKNILTVDVAPRIVETLNLLFDSVKDVGNLENIQKGFENFFAVIDAGAITVGGLVKVLGKLGSIVPDWGEMGEFFGAKPDDKMGLGAKPDDKTGLGANAKDAALSSLFVPPTMVGISTPDLVLKYGKVISDLIKKFEKSVDPDIVKQRSDIDILTDIYNNKAREIEKTGEKTKQAIMTPFNAMISAAKGEIKTVLNGAIDLEKELPKIIENTTKQIKMITEKIADSKFAENLIGLGAFEKIVETSSQIANQFAQIAGQDLDLSNLDVLRDKFNDIAGAADTMVSTINKSIESASKKIASIEQKRKTTAFDRSLVGLSPGAQQAKIEEEITRTRREGLGLTRGGKIEDAEKSFQRISTLISKISQIEKQRQSKFGITGGVAGELERQNLLDQENVQKRLIEGLEVQLKKVEGIREAQLGMEEKFQKRLDFATNMNEQIGQQNELLRKQLEKETEIVEKRKEALRIAQAQTIEAHNYARAMGKSHPAGSPLALPTGVIQRDTFAEGGIVNGPGGIDNVFARLTAGEFVMPVAETKKFYPVLKAMRDGKKFAQGGTVTSVGDINITVQGGDSREQSVREMGRQLEREIRRGTIRI